MSDPPSKRSYVSPTRQAKAEATRARILEAARSLFLEQGYRTTSTAAIARAARTSEASVFSVFENKANLLVEVIRNQVTSDSDFPISRQPVWLEYAAQDDKRPAIAALARVVRRAHDRSWRLLAIAAAAAQDDEPVAAAVARGAQGRHIDTEWGLREVIGVGDDELARKTDEVWTLISVENYRHLVVERGWAPEQYEAWLARMVKATLL